MFPNFDSYFHKSHFLESLREVALAREGDSGRRYLAFDIARQRWTTCANKENKASWESVKMTAKLFGNMPSHRDYDKHLADYARKLVFAGNLEQRIERDTNDEDHLPFLLFDYLSFIRHGQKAGCCASSPHHVRIGYNKVLLEGLKADKQNDKAYYTSQIRVLCHLNDNAVTVRRALQGKKIVKVDEKLIANCKELLKVLYELDGIEERLRRIDYVSRPHTGSTSSSASSSDAGRETPPAPPPSPISTGSAMRKATTPKAAKKVTFRTAAEEAPPSPSLPPTPPEESGSSRERSDTDESDGPKVLKDHLPRKPF